MAAVLLTVLFWVVAGHLGVRSQGLQTGVEQSTVTLQLRQQFVIQLLALERAGHMRVGYMRRGRGT